MSLPHTTERRGIQAPVHEHRNWRFLQRAAVAAHKQLGNVEQANFCALFVPAASIAVWVLQHAPHLAQRARLHVMIAHASEYEALDNGRWLRFIPWLLGRPKMELELSIVCCRGLLEPGESCKATPRSKESESRLRARLDHRLQSHAWEAVKSMAPAELHFGSVQSWSDRGKEQLTSGAARLPDLCAVFSPKLSMNYPALLSEAELLPLLRGRVPLALFSSSEAEQLVDAYMFAAAGIVLKEPDCWPNPWALRRAAGASQREGDFARMAWSATSNNVELGAFPDQRLVKQIGAAIAYIRSGTEIEQFGPDALLTLGEPLRAAAGPNLNPEAVGVLLRLPHQTAVDSESGYIFQLQDNVALLLDLAPVSASVLNTFPGHEHLLSRSIWATAVHRHHVRPFVQHADASIVSEDCEIAQMAAE